MTGDQSDIIERLRLTVPPRWFADGAPVLNGLFAGFSTCWSALYDLLQFVVRQSRLSTATAQFLDLAAKDFLSNPVLRRVGEADDDYRARLNAAIRQTRATRSAVVSAANAAGYTVSVFEAGRPLDTGAYAEPSSMAWNTVGAWGSLEMPLEALVIARSQAGSFENELWRNLSSVAPAGGAVWVRVVE